MRRVACSQHALTLCVTVPPADCGASVQLVQRAHHLLAPCRCALLLCCLHRRVHRLRLQVASTSRSLILELLLLTLPKKRKQLCFVNHESKPRPRVKFIRCNMQQQMQRNKCRTGEQPLLRPGSVLGWPLAFHASSLWDKHVWPVRSRCHCFGLASCHLHWCTPP